MKFTYLGHSAVLVETSSHTLLIDPFLSGNPLAARPAAELAPDYVLLTHAHSDHTGDAEEIAKRSGATVVAIVEICRHLARSGVDTHGMNIGGWFGFPFGRLMLTPAWHSSSFDDGSYGGMPTGIVIEAEGKRIYHAGDTALFGDMRLIGDLGLDVAFLPIGGNFTMDPEAATRAAALLRAKRVVPIHYNTFGLIRQDPAEFQRLVEADGGECLVMEPGTAAGV
jgi:L-ascorbate metabolism protein UlaG (beta-lactamase superfamily)